MAANPANTMHGSQFPLLLKFIDAKEDLSIQVHPPEGSRDQKTEAWYIIDSDPGSKLISGFKGEENGDSFLAALEKGELEDHLNEDDVSKDDLFFLPSGRIHTIGKGLLLAEIQQSSDTTYRIYDFDRKDANGSLYRFPRLSPHRRGWALGATRETG